MGGGNDREELSLMVRQLNARLSTLTQEVGTIEARQVALDRRLVEFGGLVQGLQEEQYTQQRALEHSQKALASGAERALSTAQAVRDHIEQEDEWQACLNGMNNGGVRHLEQRWEAKHEEHTRWLVELQSDIAAMQLEGGPPSQEMAKGKVSTSPGANETPNVPLGARLSALERAQQTIAVSTRRALHTALVVHKNQQDQNQTEETAKTRMITDGAKSKGDLEHEHRRLFAFHNERLEKADRRFGEQDERLDKILQMVDTLADRVLLDGSSSDGRADMEQLAREMREYADLVGEVRDKVEDMEANLYNLGSQVQALQHQQPLVQNAISDGVCDRLEAMEYLEQRVDRGLKDVCQRMDCFQEWRDQQRIALRHIGNELPEVSQKLDQLWTQCQHYFPKVKEHDVHFSFFRTSFENHKQHMLDVTGGLGQGARLHSSLQPQDGFGLFEQSARDEGMNGVGTSICDPLADRLGDRLTPVPSPRTACAWPPPAIRPASRTNLQWDAPPAALYAPPSAIASSTSPSLEANGSSAAATVGSMCGVNSRGTSGREPIAACRGPGNEARSQLQQQVMARLYSDSGAPIE